MGTEGTTGEASVEVAERTMNVRQVRLQDVTACAAIESVCFLPSEAASVEILRRRAALYPEGFLVAEQAGAIIGFVNSGCTHDPDMTRSELKSLMGHDPEGGTLVVFGLAVHPNWQGRGVSKAMLEAFIVQARTLGKAQVMLLCKLGLVEYYRKFGFADRGLSAAKHGGADWQEMGLTL